MRRHDLIFISQAAWRSLLAARDDLAADPLAVLWAENGWPLVARRAMPDEPAGVALGLPLPPFAGKRRISLLVRRQDVVSIAPPLALSTATKAAPDAWRPVLEALDQLASRHAVEARVFGSLAWHTLTSLNYVTGTSDLD